MASVAFFVNTISSALGAEMNRATSARACSISSVAAAAISYAPRWTLALTVR